LSVEELLAALERLAPRRLAAPWDNPGLQVGDPSAPVSRVLVALDPSPAAVGEAARANCQALVTHHPLILEPVKSIRLDEPLGAALALALRHGVAIISAHTNLDAAAWGVSQVLAERLGLSGVAPLEPAGEPLEGMGRLGLLPQPLSLAGLAALVRERLGVRFVRGVEGRPGAPIHRLAVCGGSGGSLIGAALAAGADALVTGDVRYHQAREAEGRLALVDCGHFNGERPVLERLAERLSGELAGRAEVRVYAGEQDPFQLY
jgi:dinuclear metal center YbgI/SA1388 family protein